MALVVSKEGLGWAKLKSRPTDISCWQGLLDTYMSAQLHWQAVYVMRQIQRLDPAALARLEMRLGSLAWRGDGDGDAMLGFPRLDEASAQIERFAGWLEDHPDDWLTWLYVARLHDFVEPFDASAQEAAIQQAKACEFIAGETEHLLGMWRLKAGDAAGSLAALTPLVDLRPLRHGSMMYLGEALMRLGNSVAAEKAFTRATLSNHPGFLSLLAARVYQHNYWQEAIGILQKAVKIDPVNTDLWLQLAKIQSQVYQLSDCYESIAQIKRLGSSNEADLLAVSLDGQYGDAENYFKQLQERYENSTKKNSRLISSVLMTSLYQDNLTAEQIADLHKSYCASLRDDEAATRKNYSENRSSKKTLSNKPLRIGYVTGDLHRQHPVNIFMLPLLQEQKKSSIEVYVYHTGNMFDAYTEKASLCADRWVNAAHLDDAMLQREILDGQIDVLIDLAGHTSSHRLGVFVGRPAPVQATFLGYPNSTGLECMDYLIGDSIVSPPEHEHLFTEQIARIDGSVFCWSPVDHYPLPNIRDDNAPVVFGSFNNALKLSPKTISLWAKVIHAVPNSRILLKAPSFRDLGVQARYRALLEEQGVEGNRIEFRGPSELTLMMQEYGDIDIALDPLPYNGGTTSMQALWMGVPVVTMMGGNFASRMGASFMTVLGKSEWIANDEASYVAIAKTLANDISQIRHGREQLRRQVESSPLGDIKSYAKNFESLMLKISGRAVA